MEIDFFGSLALLLEGGESQHTLMKVIAVGYIHTNWSFFFVFVKTEILFLFSISNFPFTP
jgi:hypothetical protein